MPRLTNAYDAFRKENGILSPDLSGDEYRANLTLMSRAIREELHSLGRCGTCGQTPYEPKPQPQKTASERTEGILVGAAVYAFMAVALFGAIAGVINAVRWAQ